MFALGRLMRLARTREARASKLANAKVRKLYLAGLVLANVCDHQWKAMPKEKGPQIALRAFCILSDCYVGPHESPNAPFGNTHGSIKTGQLNVVLFATSTQNGSVSYGVPASARSITVSLR